LADIIFKDDAERKYVERAIHPRVHEELCKIAAHLEHDEKPYMLVEVPLLFETGWEKEFDAVVVVRCDPEQQIARCMDKFALTREEAMHRIGIQRPLDAKIAKADFVVDNVGSLDETQVQVQRLYRMFEKGEFKAK
jgi:dephospho-CoA kinase